MAKQEKFNQWLTKAIKGKQGYQLVSYGRDGPKYQFEDQEGDVASMSACIWDKNQIYLHITYDGSTSVDTSQRMFAVAKDGEGLMVAVNEWLFSFKEKNDSKDNCNAVIFIQCGCISTLITATHNPPTFLVRDYVPDQADPLSIILPDLFNHLTANYQKKEAGDDAREAGSTANVDLGR